MGMFLIIMALILGFSRRDTTTRQVYMVSMGHGINQVYYLDQTGTHRMPFSPPPQDTSSMSAHERLNAQLFVYDDDNQLIQHIIPMNQTPYEIRHVTDLSINQRNPVAGDFVDPISPQWLMLVSLILFITSGSLSFFQLKHYAIVLKQNQLLHGCPV